MTPWEELMVGNYSTAIVSGFTDVLGGWFYLMFALVLVAAVQFKTDSSEATAWMMIILGAVGATTSFLNLFPPVGSAGGVNIGLMWLLMIGIGAGMIVYKIAKRNR